MRVDPERYKELLVVLPHIFRNIADHGIETPKRRAERKKPRSGTVKVEFKTDGAEANARLKMIIADDGGGIDPAAVRKKLAELNLAIAQSEDDATVIQTIFAAGFSTRSTVSTVSGRGIGLDAVKQVVDEMGGSIRVASTLGAGTTFELTLPYFNGQDLV